MRSHIREADAIVQVVRDFEDANVTHVHGEIDPENDKNVINLELILADLELAEKRLERVTDQLKGPANKELLKEKTVLEKVMSHLKNEQLLSSLELAADERTMVSSLNLLTRKPMIYVLNVSEQNLKELQAMPTDTIAICAKLESELADVPDAELPVFLRELGLENTGLDQLIVKSYELLNLITFLTTGPEETRAWTIVRGTKAPQAGGVIHTDFEKGFIRAEVINWQTLLEAGSWNQAKELGKIRLEGKEYVMKDGDTVFFHFN